MCNDVGVKGSFFLSVGGAWMQDFIIKTGDMIKFTFPPPTLIPPILAPVSLIGKGATFVMKMPACIEGDELPPPLLAPLPYTSPPFVVPGTGTLKVTLTANHKSAVAKDKKGAYLIKGTPFVAEFTVVTPAQMPPPAAVPDPLVKKVGTAEFVTSNNVVKAG